jgi:hypothetical protein
MNDLFRGLYSIAEGMVNVFSFGELSARRTRRRLEYLQSMNHLHDLSMVHQDAAKVRSRQRWLEPIVDGVTECRSCGGRYRVSPLAKVGQSINCPHCGAISWLWDKP